MRCQLYGQSPPGGHGVEFYNYRWFGNFTAKLSLTTVTDKLPGTGKRKKPIQVCYKYSSSGINLPPHLEVSDDDHKYF